MRVLIHEADPQPLVERLAARFPDIEVFGCDSYAALPDALASIKPQAQFHIRFEERPYPADALKASPGLAWIAIGGVGADHLGAWDPHSLTVTNGAGVAAESMAWYAIGSTVALAMRFPFFMRAQFRHEWRPGTVRDLRGLTMAIVGLGSTGQALAAKASALGMRVVGTRARPQPMTNVDKVHAADDLHVALADADVVAVCVPRTARTLGMIDAAAFAAMKPGAFLVDVSRGGVVDAAALEHALRSGQLGGAALDVYDPEPMPEDAPFWDMENVIITPHSCAVYEGWEPAALDIFADNLARHLAGEERFNIVDPVRGY